MEGAWPEPRDQGVSDSTRNAQAGLAAQVVAHEAEGTQVVGHLLDIGRVGQHLASLVVEQVGQRCLVPSICEVSSASLRMAL